MAYCEGDAGLGGDVCYQLSLKSDWSDKPEASLPWFALASNLPDIIKLFGEACAGKHMTWDPYARHRPLEVNLGSILRSENVLLKIPMGPGAELNPVWQKMDSSIPGLDLVKMLAGHAPEEAIYRLKGVMLEDDLGL